MADHIELNLVEEEVTLEIVGDIGPRGQVGPPGPPGSGVLYAYQQASPAAVWTIQHDLGTYPIATVVDDSGYVFFTDVCYVDDNIITINNSAPITGFAYLTGSTLLWIG